ncbi:site-specific integrase [Frateuria sp. MAH-13]|uniref:Site-specific integrase n=1 Tax=Frateuria flava TaxID=2821489 RepID=A0ABS4DQU9_9GAMM|nr:site-specific integrase [Frateuria flava]MBP1475437.1 site-specific integrase [Frateuria flava]
MYRLSRNMFADGERAPMLIDARGLPLFYPTLFTTSQLRNAGAAVNTIINKLRDILVLLAWQARQSPPRDLAVEFAQGRFLSISDIVSIRDYAALNQRFVRADPLQNARISKAFLEGNVASQQPLPVVGREQHYNRLSTIADYVEFVASTTTRHASSSAYAAEIACMARQLRKHRPRGLSRRSDREAVERTPSTELVNRFMAFSDVDFPANPFRDRAVRLRNSIVFKMFYYTGMRCGELLSLRLDKVDLGDEPRVWVIRSQDDPLDPRTNQPSAKTRERPLPIPLHLSRDLNEYIFRYRAPIKAARKHPYLFVKHRHDEGEGQPLTISALGSIIAAMRRIDPGFRALHPHSFRHYFNYQLSCAIDRHNAEAREDVGSAADVISEGRELDMRAFLNGHWSRASGEVYNRRHIQELSGLAAKAVQSNLLRKAAEGQDED